MGEDGPGLLGASQVSPSLFYPQGSLLSPSQSWEFPCRAGVGTDGVTTAPPRQIQPGLGLL
jgi:hypothetical protein